MRPECTMTGLPETLQCRTPTRARARNVQLGGPARLATTAVIWYSCHPMRRTRPDMRERPLRPYATARAAIRHQLRSLAATARLLWSLVKGLQTSLLVITGVGGYMSSIPPSLSWQRVVAVSGSLFLAVSGSTMLNMVFDRDIDAKMVRTAHRPLPSGLFSPRGAIRIGLVMSLLGIGWALALDPLYGLIVLAGLFFDVAVYTLWLKRRSSWSILWGGISGGVPVLAGRTLGLGHVDTVGLLLALGVLAWIPTHILPLNIKYSDDYSHAGVPTLPARYGLTRARSIISVSTTVTVLVMLISAQIVGIQGSSLAVLVLGGLALIGLALFNVLRPTPASNMGLFKLASIYMLCVMLLMMLRHAA